MLKKLKKLSKRQLLILWAVFFGFVLPLPLIIVGLLAFKITGVPLKKVPEEEQVRAEERVAPSQILSNKSGYNQQRLVVRGRVFPAPVVCERKACPSHDPCCGCPGERDLNLFDAGAVMGSKTQEKLKLLDSAKTPFCQRRPSSCDYQCPAWVEGAIYDVEGVFFAQPPPPGLKISLEYYFQVEDKSLVQGSTVGESVGNIFKEIREMVEKLGTSGYYVLP